MERDPVSILKKYIRLLPNSKNCSKLYLRPRKNFNPNVWFCDQPYGVNKIRSAVKDMCRQAGIVGKFSNHSLRATCATRMYQNGVPEQIIKETTGHKSDCVRTYKRTSDDLKQCASATVTGVDLEPNHMKDVEDACNESEPPPKKIKVQETCKKKFELSMSQMMENVIKSRLELRKKLYPKSRLSLRKYKGHKVTIDVNLNVKK